MIRYMYKAEFEFELGSGKSKGEVQAENQGVATEMLKDELCEAYSINKEDIKSIEFNEA